MELVDYKKGKLNIKNFQKIFFYALNTIIKLFFTRYSLYKNNFSNNDISRSSFSGIPPYKI